MAKFSLFIKIGAADRLGFSSRSPMQSCIIVPCDNPEKVLNSVFSQVNRLILGLYDGQYDISCEQTKLRVTETEKYKAKSLRKSVIIKRYTEIRHFLITINGNYLGL